MAQVDGARNEIDYVLSNNREIVQNVCSRVLKSRVILEWKQNTRSEEIRVLDLENIAKSRQTRY